MKIRELRIRYELENSAGRKIEHGVVCQFNEVSSLIDSVKKAGYQVVGIDERLRDANVKILPDEGWKQKYWPIVEA